MLRLLFFIKVLRLVGATLARAVEDVLCLCGLLLGIYFTYAVMGMQLWGRLRRGQFVNHDANFER